ncbi:unnamed protein product [Amoebophrya sp. A120]|nr:unnamed protein product [Amoebophrya sp. A120]|eukprot:GSA120T00014448001.1
MSKADWDHLITEFQHPVLEAAKDVSPKSGAVEEACKLFFSAMQITGQIVLKIGPAGPKPSADKIMGLIKPIQELANPKLDELRKKGEQGEDEIPPEIFDFLNSIFPIAMFPGMAPDTPMTFIGTFQDQMEMHALKIFKNGHDPDKKWMRALTDYVKHMIAFVKTNLGMGIKWNSRPDPELAIASAPVTTTQKAAAPAAPTPSGGEAPAPAGAQEEGSAGPAMAAPEERSSGTSKKVEKKEKKIPAPPTAPSAPQSGLLSGIQEGAAGKLRKVNDSEKNYKNKDASTSSVVPAKGSGGGGGAAAQQKAVKKIGQPKGEPKKELERDANWIVENYENGGMVELPDTNQKQSAYISNSNGTTFKIDNKIKSITVDNCEKVGLAINDVLSAVEVINCKTIYLHCQGSVNTIQSDKVDGLNVYLHTESAQNAKIVHSLSQNLNLNIMQNDDWKEMPIPTQFVCSLDLTTKKLKTEVSDIYSA